MDIANSGTRNYQCQSNPKAPPPQGGRAREKLEPLKFVTIAIWGGNVPRLEGPHCHTKKLQYAPGVLHAPSRINRFVPHIALANNIPDEPEGVPPSPTSPLKAQGLQSEGTDASPNTSSINMAASASYSFSVNTFSPA